MLHQGMRRRQNVAVNHQPAYILGVQRLEVAHGVEILRASMDEYGQKRTTGLVVSIVFSTEQHLQVSGFHFVIFDAVSFVQHAQLQIVPAQEIRRG